MGARFAAVNCLERTLAWLNRKAHRRAPELPPHLEVGFAGEDAAFAELLRRRYTVVARRWSAGRLTGDLDLVAWNGPTLCFVEVKTRTVRDSTPAEQAVDHHKQQILRRLARAYLELLPQPELPPVRFDVMSVYLQPGSPAECEHFQDVFAWNPNQPA